MYPNNSSVPSVESVVSRLRRGTQLTTPTWESKFTFCVKITSEEKIAKQRVSVCRGDNGGFSEDQINMYKECFKLMDMDKDGTINKSDLRAAFDNVGKLMDESELDEMLSEVGGACTFDGMIKMFQEKMAGGKLHCITRV